MKIKKSVLYILVGAMAAFAIISPSGLHRSKIVPQNFLANNSFLISLSHLPDLIGLTGDTQA